MDMDMPKSRLRYRQAAVNYWVALREKDADRANDESGVADRLVRQWAAQDRALEFLQPMLCDADPEVRFAAASSLLREGDNRAVGVLEELQSQPTVIGPTARLRLMKWRQDEQ
jgi:hypothetical protein